MTQGHRIANKKVCPTPPVVPNVFLANDDPFVAVRSKPNPFVAFPFPFDGLASQRMSWIANSCVSLSFSVALLPSLETPSNVIPTLTMSNVFFSPKTTFPNKVSHLIDDVVVWVIPWMILPGPNTTSFDPARNSTLNSDTGEVFLFKIPITVACLWRYHTLLIFKSCKDKLCVFVHVCFWCDGTCRRNHRILAALYETLFF